MSTAIREAEAPAINRATLSGQAQGTNDGLRVLAVAAAARHHGVDLDPADYRARAGERFPSPAALAEWARTRGLWARAHKAGWKSLFRLVGTARPSAPVILLFRDGTAGLLIAVDRQRNVVWVRDPRHTADDQAVAVDEFRLAQAWSGEVLLVRRERGASEADRPFNFSWLMRLVFGQRRTLVNICVASIVLSALTVVPPLLVMSVVDRVVVHHSVSTLLLLSVILGLITFYETLLGFARRELVQVVSTRVDATLNLHVFNRLLSLPLDYFEKNAAGQINYRVAQVWKVRDFLTGKLMGTFLDFFTLLVLLPVLFWMEATLAWVVIGCAALITLLILCFLPAMRSVIGKWTTAESRKGSVLVETVHGIRTVKSLAIEPQRRTEWDERVAEAGELKLKAGRLANWPQTLIQPIDSFIQRGVIMLGAYLALSDTNGVAVGGLIAFMMLGARVAQPLVGLARLIEDFEDVRTSVNQVGMVLNNPNETAAMQGGLRPRFTGAIRFEDLTFTYPGSKTPALDKVSFEIPPGSMLGIVGRSGSGKSTITRLLQGINREYSGFLKIDGVEMREINLTHLRKGFGMVLQDNFLFRGTVRDNIAAGRPGLTLDDVVRAARLAGAEEFIERLPAGYETIVEEGSANLSGGQKQRLAIARAVIENPRVLILDEATSALDPESESLVNANLTRIGKGRTTVIVSHRLSSLVECDQILVLDKGQVVDIGPHRALIERCAVYRTLWMQQNRHLEPVPLKPAPLMKLAGQAE